MKTRSGLSELAAENAKSHTRARRMTTPSNALSEYLRNRAPGEVKLHLGCGGVRWQDFINVDLHPHTDAPDSSRSGCVADVFADIRHLGLEANSVDQIFTSHVLEHFPRWETEAMLRDWHRMLRQGGRLVVEMPDFWRCVMWLFHPSKRKRELGRSQFYGNQWDRLEFETHRYVWSGSEFKRALREAGFRSVRLSHRTRTHQSGRDMRVVAIKR